MSDEIHVLQHIPTDGPSLIGDWLLARGRRAKMVRIDHGEPVPAAPEVSGLIVLGGTMNVDQEREHPWLRDEKRLLEAHLRSERPVLGICLGGQMLARVLGASVIRNRGWEIGWHPVRFAEDATAPARELELFQWHEDTFGIPAGARRLASSAACENQAFAWGARAVGLQFHPEVDEEWIRVALAEVALPAPRSGFDVIQSRDAMLADIESRVKRSREFLFGLLDGIFGPSGAGVRPGSG